jgi:ABC-type lipoprotein export system ATPase subunit/GNAT superfamily N-acetyltransferase
MKADIAVSSEIERTARVVQVEGMFDVPPSKRTEQRWSVDLPIEEKSWNVGLIVGPSGCGKSTVARQLFGEALGRAFAWPATRAILDGFPSVMGIKDIVELLSSVGFSSPPSWVKPFGVLSNGEQFRVTLARLLAELPELAVVDEFTSVVDRVVAQVGSAALEKTVRRRGQKFVAVTCHEDVEAWLRPDWVYRPSEQRFAWRCLQRRPPIDITIQRVHHSAWNLFKRHHYLTQALSSSAFCFVAFWHGRPVAFDAWLPFVGKLKDARKGRRGHRTVCLPDFQGVGIGNALFTFCASLWKGLGYRAFSCTGHPAEIRSRARSKDWKMTRGPSHTARDTGAQRSLARTRATARLTASFEFVGQGLDAERARDVLATWARVC